LATISFLAHIFLAVCYLSQKLIVANWKMYKTPEEAWAYIAAFLLW